MVLPDTGGTCHDLFEDCRFDYIHKQRNSSYRSQVEFNVEFWKAVLKKLTDFYIGYMIPELLTQKILQKLP